MQLVLDDLKSSIYARIWTLLWIIAIIFIIIAIVNYGSLNSVNERESSFRMWIEDKAQSGISFPQMKVSTQESTVHFDFFGCSFYNQAIKINDCDPKIKDCKILIFDSFNAMKGQDNITCIIVLKYDNVNKSNSAIKWEIIQPSTNDNHPTLTAFVNPDDDAAILLKKEVYFMTKSTTTWIDWNPRTVYFNNIQEPNALVVSIIMYSFYVTNFERYDFYTSWMSFADIGGVMFIIYAIHTVIMILVGCVIKNDSHTLGGVSYKSIS